MLKRTLDITVSFAALIVSSPVILGTAIVINKKIGKPIFFKQTRPGKDEKPFEILKFRTMTDERDLNGELLPDKDRMTKTGDFIRKTSIDELPQLINVLKGDLSLVGPRTLDGLLTVIYRRTKKATSRKTWYNRMGTGEWP